MQLSLMNIQRDISRKFFRNCGSYKASNSKSINRIKKKKKKFQAVKENSRFLSFEPQLSLPPMLGKTSFFPPVSPFLYIDTLHTKNTSLLMLQSPNVMSSNSLYNSCVSYNFKLDSNTIYLEILSGSIS